MITFLASEKILFITRLAAKDLYANGIAPKRIINISVNIVN